VPRPHPAGSLLRLRLVAVSLRVRDPYRWNSVGAEFVPRTVIRARRQCKRRADPSPYSPQARHPGCAHAAYCRTPYLDAVLVRPEFLERAQGQFFRTSGSARPADLHVAPAFAVAQSVAHALEAASFWVYAAR
jgi:hypothetical protein